MTLTLEEKGNILKKEADYLRALKHSLGRTKGWYQENILNLLPNRSSPDYERPSRSYPSVNTEDEGDNSWEDEKLAYERITYARQEKPLYEGIIGTLEKQIRSHEITYRAVLAEIKQETRARRN